MTRPRHRHDAPMRLRHGSPAESTAGYLGEPARVLVAGVALAASLALAACSGSPGAKPSPTPEPTTAASETAASTDPGTGPATLPPPLDACAVVTKADAEALAGTPVADGVAGNPLNPSCTYTAPVTGPVGQVSVFLGAGAKKTYDIELALNHVFTDVPGIGDEAHEEQNAIFVRKGTTWMAIELVRLNDPAENRVPLEDAAKRAVTRLP